MTARPRVAIIADKRRQDAVGQALYLLGDQWPSVPPNGTVLKPNLVSHRKLTASTHPTTLGAIADYLYHRGAEELIIAEGASDATAGFENLGHKRMFWHRPVRWFDINRDESQWMPIELVSTNGLMRTARLSRTMADAPFVVSVAQAKTHVNTMLTASMKNLMSCLHPQDRINMHGYASGSNGHTGIKSKIIDWLKGESQAVAWATSGIGRAKQAGLIARRFTGQLRWNRLSETQREFCKSIAALHSNLVRLNQAVGPKLAVVDGFSGMDGEGPRLGRPRNFGWIVAGNDPVAVDTVTAHLMGLPVDDIGHLMLARQVGLGSADLERIELVGDPIEKLVNRCRRHSHAPLQHLWRDALEAIGANAIPTPGHIRKIPAHHLNQTEQYVSESERTTT